MKCTFLLALVIFITFCAEDSNAWWGGSRSGSSSSSSSSRSGSRNSVWNTLKTKYEYAKGYVNGAKEMKKAYNEMRKANFIGSDKYFHAKGNYNAAKQGPGGIQAAKDISNLREYTDKIRYKVQNKLGKISDTKYNALVEDSKKDQEANEWGRSGGDPNKYRVNGIPSDLRK